MMSRCLWAFLPLQVSVMAGLNVCVVSKLIIDTVDGGERRLGGGGVQAAVGVRLAVPLANCRLVAPAGRDLDEGLLGELRVRGINPEVHRLNGVPTTPGERITYEGERMSWEPVGWEGWDRLCAWVPPLDGAEMDALHVLVEGGGSGEVEAALRCASRPSPPLISVEPVMHSVNPSVVASLRRLTRHADIVSPDLLTATRIAALAGPIAGGNDALAFTARTCAAALEMRPGSVLAIRDGRRGSHIFTLARGDAAAGAAGEFRHIPSVEVATADPTGAGNAYAGALCARIAAGAAPVHAAACASAVGAAFAATAAWAPADVEQAARWVRQNMPACLSENDNLGLP
jgi:sugar/nucleoside kinase (ribokinase family)